MNDKTENYTIFLLMYATNNIYHIAYYYKQSTKLLEIHNLSKQYLLHICVLSLSVMTVLADAWILSYCQYHYSAIVGLNWWLHYHEVVEKNSTTIAAFARLIVLILIDLYDYWDWEQAHCAILLILIQKYNTLVCMMLLELNIQWHCWHESIEYLLLFLVMLHYLLFL